MPNYKLMKKCIQSFFIKRRNENKKEFSLEYLKDICIIVDDEIGFIEESKKYFKEKNISPLFIIKKEKKKNIILNTKDFYYTKKDFNVIGIPKKKLRQYLKTTQADLLISFLNEVRSEQNYIINMFNSPIKIGIKSNDIYDIVIKKTKDILNKDFLEDIFNYLKHIKK